MRPANILRLYRVRLRARIVQEVLAIAGIAAGVALLFASQVSSQSLRGSVDQLSRGIAGSATLQLVARSEKGFPEAMLQRVRRISGVRVATPILEAAANASGPAGSESVELVGADRSLAQLGGSLVHHLQLEPFGGVGGVVLTAPLAHTIGVERFGREVTFQAAGKAMRAPLYETLPEHRIGALAASPIAIVPLFFAQEIAGLEGRVSRILVAPAAGAQARVRTALEMLAAGHLDVEGIDYDEKLFATAAAASNQSTALFSTISALVGFLFAFNATLLTLPQRRRLIVDLRRDGYTPRTVIAVLLVDGLVLGLLASALGLALGEELSVHLLHSEPSFFSLAFTVGSQRVVSPQSMVIAVGGGMLAALVAVLSPLRDVLSRDPLAAIAVRNGFGSGLESGGARSGARPALAGLACLAAATALLLAAPDAAIGGMILLVAALLLELPLALAVALTLIGALARTIVSPVPHVATMELSAARTRAVAIAATGALAVFGSVAIGGSRDDLLAGLDNAVRETNASTGIWVAPSGAYNLLHTTPFVPAQQTKLERLPGVRAVHLYRGGLLDYGARRTLVIAPSRLSNPLLPAGQIVRGDPRQAEARVRAGGWLVLSQAIATEQHLHIGESFRLPSPDPMSFRVAALSTNIGWAPGAIVMNGGDYARAWGSEDASAYSILLARNFPAAWAVAEIERAIGPPARSGLSTQTAAQHADQQRALDRGALARLTEIATLIPIFAALAMAAAIGAMVWQRRPRLAKLKLEGLPRAELWQTILLESLLLLCVGCLSGTIFGLYGQQLADRALARVIDFPVVHSVAPLAALGSLTLVMVSALAILAIPGYLAASVPAALALQD